MFCMLFSWEHHSKKRTPPKDKRTSCVCWHVAWDAKIHNNPSNIIKLEHRLQTSTTSWPPSHFHPFRNLSAKTNLDSWPRLCIANLSYLKRNESDIPGEASQKNIRNSSKEFWMLANLYKLQNIANIREESQKFTQMKNHSSTVAIGWPTRVLSANLGTKQSLSMLRQQTQQQMEVTWNTKQ